MGPACLTERHREVVQAAAVLAGGRRLLKWFPDFEGEPVLIGAHAKDSAAELAERSKDTNVVVLASGDALFFGIARLFVELLPADRITIIPNVTAAQSALARLKIPWETARFFSVHGRDLVLPWREILGASTAVIYTDSRRPPRDVAGWLIERCDAAAARRGAVVSGLGEREQVDCGTLSELATIECGKLSMLVVFGPDKDGPVTAPPVPLGLEDETYLHERNMITHSEVRAVALSKLGLGPGVMWDVGAGSGSVGVEACGLCDALHVYSIEEKEERAAHVSANAKNAGCSGLTVLTARALDVISDLPAPRSVFVGGGGSEIKAIAESCFKRLRPGGTMVAVAVLAETRSALLDALPGSRLETIEVSVRRSRPLGAGNILAPENPVTIVVYRKEEKT